MNHKNKLPEKNKRTMSAYGPTNVKLSDTGHDQTTDPTQTSGDPTNTVILTTTHLLGFRR
ncbi:MAG: hypothetical protein V4592_08215 [Bacteroidota bacterium]